MPKLPTAEALGERPRVQPSTGVSGYTSTTGAETATAEAVGRFGDLVTKIAVEKQDELDTVFAEDSWNKYKKAASDLALGDKGFAHKKGIDSQGIYPTYTAQLGDVRKQIFDQLRTEEQKKKFNERANITDLQFGDSLLKHVTHETDAFKKAVYQDTLKTELDSIGLNFNDPAAVAGSLRRVDEAIDREAKRLGVPTLKDSEMRLFRDQASVQRYSAWRMVDPVGALTDYQENAKLLSPNVRLKLGESLFNDAAPLLAGQIVAKGGIGIGNVVERAPASLTGERRGVSRGTLGVTPAVERFAPFIDANAATYGVDAGVMRRQLQAESGGNPDAMNMADIQVTGSPSIGIAQFQPATAKRYGIDPKVPEQAIKGQAAYMADLLKMFGGDYQKALAGYNWGEGNVEKAVAKWGDAWFSHAPKSTQDYINKIVETSKPVADGGASAETGAGGGAGGDGAAADTRPTLHDYIVNPSLPTGNALVDALPADQKMKVITTAAALGKKDDTLVRAQVQARVKDNLAEAITNGGVMTNPPSIEELAKAYGPAQAVQIKSHLNNTAQLGLNLKQVQTLPDAALDRLLVETKPALGEGFAERQKNFEILGSAITQVKTQRQADPIGYALATQSYGLKPMTPETLSNPQELAKVLAARKDAAPSIAADYGTGFRMLSKPEQSALNSVVSQSPVPVQKQYLAAIYAGTGDMRVYRSMMQQIAPDNPVLASAGIDQARGSQTLADKYSPKMDVADLVLTGQAILHPNVKEDGKDSPGKGAALIKMPEDKFLLQDWNAETKDAFKGKPQALSLQYQRALSIYAAWSSRVGKMDGEYNAERWKGSIRLATGGLADQGGARIVLPYGMKEDDFKEALRFKTDSLVGIAAGVTPAEMMRMPLENVRDGAYRVRNGMGYVHDKAGQIVEIDFNGYVPQAPATFEPPAARLNPGTLTVTRGGAVTSMGKPKGTK